MAKERLLLSNIQMLRAVAAVFVVFHHVLPHYMVMGGSLDFITSSLEWGFLGVDIFFVISGFIMAYTTFNKERTFSSAKTFFKHRLFRIYLGYWVFFIIMSVMLFITNPQKLFNLDILGSFFLINSNMFELVLPISWSLSYELYFYFLFIFTFFFSVKQLNILMPLVMLLILAISIYSYFKVNFIESFFYSPFLLEFFAGVLLYIYRDYMLKLWMLPLVIILAIVAYGYGIEYELKNGILRIATFGMGALLVVMIALIIEQHKIYSAGKLLQSLGDSSYTLYLSHLIIIELFYHVGLRSFFTGSQYRAVFGLLFVTFLSVVFSLIYYKFIEKPIYKKALKYGEDI